MAQRTCDKAVLGVGSRSHQPSHLLYSGVTCRMWPTGSSSPARPAHQPCSEARPPSRSSAASPYRSSDSAACSCCCVRATASPSSSVARASLSRAASANRSDRTASCVVVPRGRQHAQLKRHATKIPSKAARAPPVCRPRRRTAQNTQATRANDSRGNPYPNGSAAPPRPEIAGNKPAHERCRFAHRDRYPRRVERGTHHIGLHGSAASSGAVVRQRQTRKWPVIANGERVAADGPPPARLTALPAASHHGCQQRIRGGSIRRRARGQRRGDAKGGG